MYLPVVARCWGRCGIVARKMQTQPKSRLRNRNRRGFYKAGNSLISRKGLMNLSLKQTPIRISLFILALALILPAASRAQGTNPNMQVDKENQQDQDQQLKQRTMQNGQPVAKVDPKEEAAYK